MIQFSDNGRGVFMLLRYARFSIYLQTNEVSLLAFVCPSLYFSASKPTISKRDFAAALSFLALATAAAAKMLYLKTT